MKQYRIVSVLILLLATISGFSQYKISGKITDKQTGKPVNDVEIYLDAPIALWQDEIGGYVLSNLAPGNYEIAFFSYEYNIIQKKITITNQDIILNISLEEFGANLSEIVIADRKKELFGLSRLKEVQDMAIYAGKKTEVILLNKTVANLATNNPRQIYSKVAGLNIWESDGSGLQLGIGGRGLDPNRTSNINVRQNGYDISADALGYPESYYTPPTEALEKIEIVRGAASLQYGTQFGGLLNFKIKTPVKNKSISFTTRQTIGTYGLFNSYNSASGTVNKFSYNTYFHYKRGDGWRENSDFEQVNFYINLNYQLGVNTSIKTEFTHMNYLAHQAGGLSDFMYTNDANQSNRQRNWFEVNWNLWAIHLNHSFSKNTKANIRIYGLNASRKALGYRNYRPSVIDPLSERELIVGKFKTLGVETRFLHHYKLWSKNATFLLGGRYYQGNNTGEQGLGTIGSDPNFSFISLDDHIKQTFTDEVSFNSSNYKYPNKNLAFFGEHIFNISDKLSVTPGARFEYINTKANGFYRIIRSNQAGDIVIDNSIDENRNFSRQFLLLGIGLSYKSNESLEIYGNISQNYKSITFSDIRVTNPNSLVDPNIKDENGYSIDLGLRGKLRNILQYDITGFYLNGDDRLGDILAKDENSGILKRIRTNVGRATILGVESLVQLNILPAFKCTTVNHKLEAFINTAYIKSEYTKQYFSNTTKQIKGNEVEFVPALNIKTGLQYAFKNFKTAWQYSYISKQFTDATNAISAGGTGTIGEIPSYGVMDISFSYEWSNWTFETGVNNLLNKKYFTRRATGYPGPGIIPSDAISTYFTVQLKL